MICTNLYQLSPHHALSCLSTHVSLLTYIQMRRRRLQRLRQLEDLPLRSRSDPPVVTTTPVDGDRGGSRVVIPHEGSSPSAAVVSLPVCLSVCHGKREM